VPHSDRLKMFQFGDRIPRCAEPTPVSEPKSRALETDASRLNRGLRGAWASSEEFCQPKKVAYKTKTPQTQLSPLGRSLNRPSPESAPHQPNGCVGARIWLEWATWKTGKEALRGEPATALTISP
jgi:hypothetical protein